MRKLLIHSCCAPCFVYVKHDVEENGIINNVGEREMVDFTALFYNPNIHPKVEYERRKQAFINFCEKENVKNVVIDSYVLDEYVKYVVLNVGENKAFSTRCEYCYYMRLEESFKYAKENGFDMVMTTLAISPYQNHDMIKKVGKNLSEKYSIEFIYNDYRENFREGQNMARQYDIYMQKYCGCVFSFDKGKWVY